MRGNSSLFEEVLAFKAVAIYLFTYSWCLDDAVSNSDYVYMTSVGRVYKQNSEMELVWKEDLVA
jgi:hypothetical protein